jgi:hypothetical protein
VYLLLTIRHIERGKTHDHIDTSSGKPDFSLVLGGPFYRLLRRAHLTGPALEQLPRRILFFALITWLPLAVLTLIEGNPTGMKLTFLHDIEAQVRTETSCLSHHVGGLEPQA